MVRKDNMTEEEQNFILWKDNDYKLIVKVYFEPGYEMSLNDLTIYWGMGEKPNSEIPNITKSSNLITEIEITNEDEFTIYIDRTDTVDLARGKYYHEARATNSNGDVSILMTGTVTLKDVLLDIV